LSGIDELQERRARKRAQLSDAVEERKTFDRFNTNLEEALKLARKSFTYFSQIQFQDSVLSLDLSK
jgi:hypothetical protein